MSVSEENKNVRVEQTHDRSGQPDEHNVAVHHEIKMLNIDNELICERIEEEVISSVWLLVHLLRLLSHPC